MEDQMFQKMHAMLSHRVLLKSRELTKEEQKKKIENDWSKTKSGNNRMTLFRRPGCDQKKKGKEKKNNIKFETKNRYVEQETQRHLHASYSKNDKNKLEESAEMGKLKELLAKLEKEEKEEEKGKEFVDKEFEDEEKKKSHMEAEHETKKLNNRLLSSFQYISDIYHSKLQNLILIKRIINIFRIKLGINSNMNDVITLLTVPNHYMNYGYTSSFHVLDIRFRIIRLLESLNYNTIFEIDLEIEGQKKKAQKKQSGSTTDIFTIYTDWVKRQLHLLYVSLYLKFSRFVKFIPYFNLIFYPYIIDNIDSFQNNDEFFSYVNKVQENNSFTKYMKQVQKKIKTVYDTILQRKRSAQETKPNVGGNKHKAQSNANVNMKTKAQEQQQKFISYSSLKTDEKIIFICNLLLKNFIKSFHVIHKLQLLLKNGKWLRKMCQKKKSVSNLARYFTKIECYDIDIRKLIDEDFQRNKKKEREKHEMHKRGKGLHVECRNDNSNHDFYIDKGSKNQKKTQMNHGVEPTSLSASVSTSLPVSEEESEKENQKFDEANMDYDHLFRNMYLDECSREEKIFMERYTIDNVSKASDSQINVSHDFSKNDQKLNTKGVMKKEINRNKFPSTAKKNEEEYAMHERYITDEKKKKNIRNKVFYKINVETVLFSNWFLDRILLHFFLVFYCSCVIDFSSHLNLFTDVPSITQGLLLIGHYLQCGNDLTSKTKNKYEDGGETTLIPLSTFVLYFIMHLFYSFFDKKLLTVENKKEKQQIKIFLKNINAESRSDIQDGPNINTEKELFINEQSNEKIINVKNASTLYFIVKHFDKFLSYKIVEDVEREKEQEQSENEIDIRRRNVSDQLKNLKIQYFLLQKESDKETAEKEKQKGAYVQEEEEVEVEEEEEKKKEKEEDRERELLMKISKSRMTASKKKKLMKRKEKKMKQQKEKKEKNFRFFTSLPLENNNMDYNVSLDSVCAEKIANRKKRQKQLYNDIVYLKRYYSILMFYNYNHKENWISPRIPNVLSYYLKKQFYSNDFFTTELILAENELIYGNVKKHSDSNQDGKRNVQKPRTKKKEELEHSTKNRSKEEMSNFSLINISRTEKILIDIIYMRLISCDFRNYFFLIFCNYRKLIDMYSLPYLLDVFIMMHNFFSINDEGVWRYTEHNTVGKDETEKYKIEKNRDTSKEGNGNAVKQCDNQIEADHSFIFKRNKIEKVKKKRHDYDAYNKNNNNYNNSSSSSASPLFRKMNLLRKREDKKKNGIFTSDKEMDDTGKTRDIKNEAQDSIHVDTEKIHKDFKRHVTKITYDNIILKKKNISIDTIFNGPNILSNYFRCFIYNSAKNIFHNILSKELEQLFYKRDPLHDPEEGADDGKKQELVRYWVNSAEHLSTNTLDDEVSNIKKNEIKTSEREKENEKNVRFMEETDNQQGNSAHKSKRKDTFTEKYNSLQNMDHQENTEKREKDLIMVYVNTVKKYISEIVIEIIFYSNIWNNYLPLEEHPLIVLYAANKTLMYEILKLKKMLQKKKQLCVKFIPIIHSLYNFNLFSKEVILQTKAFSKLQYGINDVLPNESDENRAEKDRQRKNTDKMSSSTKEPFVEKREEQSSVIFNDESNKINVSTDEDKLDQNKKSDDIFINLSLFITNTTNPYMSKLMLTLEKICIQVIDEKLQHNKILLTNCLKEEKLIPLNTPHHMHNSTAVDIFSIISHILEVLFEYKCPVEWILTPFLEFLNNFINFYCENYKKLYTSFIISVLNQFTDKYFNDLINLKEQQRIQWSKYASDKKKKKKKSKKKGEKGGIMISNASSAVVVTNGQHQGVENSSNKNQRQTPANIFRAIEENSESEGTKGAKGGKEEEEEEEEEKDEEEEGEEEETDDTYDNSMEEEFSDANEIKKKNEKSGTDGKNAYKHSAHSHSGVSDDEDVGTYDSEKEKENYKEKDIYKEKESSKEKENYYKEREYYKEKEKSFITKNVFLSKDLITILEEINYLFDDSNLSNILVVIWNLHFFLEQLPIIKKKFEKYIMKYITERTKSVTQLTNIFKNYEEFHITKEKLEKNIYTKAILDVLDTSLNNMKNTLHNTMYQIFKILSIRIICYEFQEELFFKLYNPFEQYQLKNVISIFPNTIETLFIQFPKKYYQNLLTVFTELFTKMWALIIVEKGFANFIYQKEHVTIMREDNATLQMYMQNNNITTKHKFLKKNIDICEYMHMFLDILTCNPEVFIQVLEEQKNKKSKSIVSSAYTKGMALITGKNQDKDDKKNWKDNIFNFSKKKK